MERSRYRFANVAAHGARANRRRQCGILGVTSALALVAIGCEPELDIGAWKCAQAPLFVPPDGSPILAGKDTTVVPDWSTSFEDGFCGYAKASGYCYTDPDAVYSLVEAPARTGRRAAAFTIRTDEAAGRQTRCVREGLLPQDAYYGAWFYIPTAPTNNGNWNLMHFQGADDDGTELRGLWDVSIQTTDTGRMLPRLVRLLGRDEPTTHADVELPSAEWFSLQLRFKRAATEEGAVALYFNGELVAEQNNVITDDSDWGQWYLGNLADNLSPAESTIYIDDVSIRRSLGADN